VEGQKHSFERGHKPPSSQAPTPLHIDVGVIHSIQQRARCGWMGFNKSPPCQLSFSRPGVKSKKSKIILFIFMLNRKIPSQLVVCTSSPATMSQIYTMEKIFQPLWNSNSNYGGIKYITDIELKANFQTFYFIINTFVFQISIRGST
jgi:hypothetical protein